MTIFDFLIKNTHFFRHVIGWKKGGRLYHLNLEEYVEQIEKHVALLKSMGVKKGSRVGIICKTRYEWHLFDMALLASGAIGVPLYPNTNPTDIKELQKVCKLELLILENASQTDLFDSDSFEKCKFLAIDEGHFDHSFNIVFYKDALNNLKAQPTERLEDLCSNINGPDVCNYLLTSGTTNMPKVSIITHEQLYYLLDNIRHLIEGKLAPGSRSLTHLPLAHVLGRCDSFLHLILPTQTVFCESIDSLIRDLEVIKPSFMITVPRLISKLRQKIILNIHSKGPLINQAFELAMVISEKYQEKIERGLSLTQWEKLIYNRIHNHTLKGVRDKISPNLKFIVSGGAPLNDDDYEFFSALGIPILQGYGLTETLGPVCLNFFGSIEKGTIGKPFKDVDIRLEVDGEIAIKAPFLLAGYLDENGEIHREHFQDDGYFRTGDIGELLPSGNLKITDRKKDLIVTSYGKNVSPLKIEGKMMTSERIEHFMAVGEGKPFISGLVAIKKEAFYDLIDSGAIDNNSSLQDLTNNTQVIEILKNEIEKINEELSDFEKVKRFRIIPIDLTGEADFLTPSLKIKRDRIYNKYIDLIDSMYQNS